jgi:hypothetical protein
MAAIGAGYTVAALAPVYVACLPGFALAGLGNGLLMVHERLLVQSLVAERGQGRAFGTLDMAASWAFAGALVLGAVAVAVAGARPALLIAGLGTLLVWCACALSVRRPGQAAAVLD